jgi:tRNA A-37 threonylcarbamoyl transferase component Bud32
MSSGAKGGDAPDDGGTGSGSPPRYVVRSKEATPGESSAFQAADTAVARQVDEPAATRPTAPGPAGSGDEATVLGSGTDAGVPAVAYVTDGADPLLGTVLLGRYSVTRKIGQGGMGAVYEATHTLIGKRVAVKVLLDKYARREQVVARLEQEARLASAIGHEHIIDITDFGTTHDGRTFVVMEFLEGESLAECLAREGPLPETRILQITFQIASALGAAHAKGIVHRDVKPENVFLLRRKDQDFIKVVDFGISKSMRASQPGEEESPRLTQTGMVLGTPLYMSPEQARGDEELDHRIDIYALGVIMYELATGQVPFLGTNYLSIISQVLNDEAPRPRQVRPELSEEFEAIVLRLLEKDRDRRYQTTEEVVHDLTVLLDDPTRSTQRARILPPRRRTKRSALKVLGWVAGVSVVIAAVAVTVAMLRPGGAAGSGPAAALVASDAGVAIVADAAPAAVVEPELVKIPIDTVPQGATIYEGGRVIGTTPTFYEAPIGNDKIELIASLPDHDDTRFTINPLVDRKRTPDNPVRVELRRPKKGASPVIIRKAPTPGAPRPSQTTTPDDTAGGELRGNPFRRGEP